MEIGTNMSKPNYDRNWWIYNNMRPLYDSMHGRILSVKGLGPTDMFLTREFLSIIFIIGLFEEDE